MESEDSCELENVGRVPSTVNTLYHARNSNVFRSSESSVQITSAPNNNNSCAPTQSQNFCELDIVTRRERERKEALRSIDHQIKGLQMSRKHQGVFRKKIYDKQVKERRSGVLRLGNVVKDVDEDYCKPIITQSRVKKDRTRSPAMLSRDPEDNTQKQLVDFLKREFREHIEENESLEVNDDELHYRSRRVKHSRSVSQRRRSPQKGFDQRAEKPTLGDPKHTVAESDISHQNLHRDIQSDRMKMYIPCDLQQYKQKQLGNFLNREFREHINENETVEYNYDNEVFYEAHCVKKTRSMSRRRKGKSRSPEPKPDPKAKITKQGEADNALLESTDSVKKTIKFADIEEARTMYFVKLPNQNAFSSPGNKGKKKVKNKHQRNFGECSRFVDTVEDPKLGRIIVNKMETEMPTFASLDTESSVPVKLKSPTSLDCIVMVDKKKTSNKQHQNSPRVENIEKTANKIDRKLKHKKKHRPSPRESVEVDHTPTKHQADNTCDTVPCKEEKKRDAEVSILYKKRNDDMLEYPDLPVEKHRHKSPKARQKSPVKESKGSSAKAKSTRDKSSKKDKASGKEKSPCKEKPKKNKVEQSFDGQKKQPNTASVRRLYETDGIPKNLKVNGAMEPHQAHTDPRTHNAYIDFSTSTPKFQTNSGNSENNKHHPKPNLINYDHLPERLNQSVLKSVNFKKRSSPTRHAKYPETVDTGDEIKLNYQQAIMLETTEIQGLQDDDAVVSIYITDSVLKSGSYSIAHDGTNSRSTKTPPMLTLKKNKYGPVAKPGRICLKTSPSNDFNAAFRRRKVKKKHVSKGKINISPPTKKDVTLATIDTKSIPASVESIEKDIDNSPEEKSIQTTNMASDTQCQEVAVCTPAHKYLGYFIPPQVAERFSRKYSSPHTILSTELSTKSSAVPVQDSLLLPHIRSNRSRSCVIKKGENSGFDETDITSRPSKMQLNSRMSSDTQICIAVPRKKRSKSVVTKAECTDFDMNTLNTIESQEHLCNELKKLIVLQQIDSKRKRLKVVPKTIERRRITHEFLHMNGLAESDKKPSNRLKPKQPSRSEQEAILNLPICHHDGTTTSNLPSTSDISSKFKSNSIISRNTGSRYSLSTEDEPYLQEVKKKRKKIKKSSDRCQVSAVNLSVKPISELQCTSVVESTGGERHILARDPSELNSVSTSRSYVFKEERRLVGAHMILGEKILEICNKAINKDGKVLEGYIVSGMEPPKRLTYTHNLHASPRVLDICEKLHLMFFPPTLIFNGEITPKEPYTFGKFMQQQAVKETICEKQIIENTAQSPEESKSKEIIRSPIQVKTKRKLIPFENKKKCKCSSLKKRFSEMKIFKKSEPKLQLKSKSGSSLSLDVSTTSEMEPPKELTPTPADMQRKPKKALSPPREIRSLSRINSAVKVMESSLQIIKEESQSTDSSSKNCKGKPEKKSNLDIKQSSTQTELITNDIEKLKDVINYLYFAMDKRMSADTISTDTVRTDDVQSHVQNKMDRVDFSSTDTSSCCEQFKNMVKNVKPKFGTLRRMSRSDLAHKSPVISRTCSVDGGFSCIPTRTYRRPYSHRTEYGFVFNEPRGEVPTTPVCSASVSTIPKENTMSQKRSISLDIITPDRYPTHFNRQCMVQQNVVEKVDKAISTDPRPEIKSSTSISDFSSIVITLDESEKLIQPVETQKNFNVTQNEEKSIQCVITEPISRRGKSETDKSENSRTQTRTIDLRSTRPHHPSCISEQISVSTEKDGPSKGKKFEHKSLQTSISNLVERKKPEPISIPIPFQANEIYNIDMPKRSSHSFIGTRRRHLPCPSLCTPSNNSGVRETEAKSYKMPNDDKPSGTASCKESSKVPEKKVVEMDYAHLLKLERHLEQVLGLYPTVCKAIRAHMAKNMNNKKVNKRTKYDGSKMFTSQETLATTVDTITEYNMIDTDDSRSKERMNRNMSMKLPLNKYLFESHVKFQKSLQRNKHYGSKCNVFPSKADERYGGRGTGRDILEPMSPCPFTDTSSTSGEDYFLRYGKGRKSSKSRWNSKKKRRGDCDSSNMFSDDLKDNWSVGSPLYSISTPSLTFSKTDYAMPKSKSLTHSTTNQINTSQLSTSKSLVEISSSKSLNRKVLMKRLKDDILKDGRSKSFRLGTQQVFVLSVDSSKPLRASPSKLLATVEQQLKQTERTNNLKAAAINECKRLGEQNSYGMLFSDHDRVQRGDATFNHRPFYIHNTTRGSSSDVLLDSLNYKNSRTLKSDEEDLGNFSADSLESSDSRGDFNYSMDFMCSNLMPPKQNYFVYTSTVNYGTNGLKHDSDRSRTPSRQTASKRSSSSKQSSSKTKPAQTSEALVGTTASLSAVQTSSTNKTSDDSSNTLLSESGYETSNRTKPTASIKNFFKKGGSLLDIFRHSSKTKAVGKVEDTPSGTNLTNFSNLWSKSRELHSEPSTRNIGVSAKAFDESSLAPTKVYWASMVAKDKVKQPNITFTSAENHTGRPERKDKGTSTCVNKRCSVSCTKNYEKQKHECHQYAEKVMLESQLRKEGNTQYKDFKEIPLELLIGRPVPSKKSHRAKEMPSTCASTSGRKYPYCDHEVCLKESVPYVTIADDKIIFTSTSPEKQKPEPAKNPPSKKYLWACGSLNNLRSKPKFTSKGVQRGGAYEEESRPIYNGKVTQTTEQDDNVLGYYRKMHDKAIGVSRKDKRVPSRADMGCSCAFDADVIEALQKVPVGTMTFGDIPANLQQEHATRIAPIEETIPRIKMVTDKEPLRSALKNRSDVTIGRQDTSEETEIPVPPLTMDSIDDISQEKWQDTSQTDDASMESAPLGLYHAVKSQSRMKVTITDAAPPNATVVDSEKDEVTPFGTAFTASADANKDLQNDYLPLTEYRGSQNVSKEGAKALGTGFTQSDESPLYRGSENEAAKQDAKRLGTGFTHSDESPMYRGSENVKTKQDAKPGSSDTPPQAAARQGAKPLYTSFAKKNDLPELPTGQTKTAKEDVKSLLSSLTHADHLPDKPADVELKPPDTASTDTINLSEAELLGDHKVVIKDGKASKSDSVGSIDLSQEIVRSSHSCQSFVEKIMEEILASAVDESYLGNIRAEEASRNALSDDESFIDIVAKDEAGMMELTQDEARRQASEDYRSGLTDKQVFDKLLTSFEKEDEIAVRLSKDETFFNEQIKTLKKSSDESLDEDGSLDKQEGNLFNDELEDKHRSTHFWEEKMKALRAKEDNPVKTDDIGTCFSRGFRPDNIALSGDACFNLNKQDKLKFTKGMLTNEESIIDFSERETPLDYLLALGFMVDEASNALKDDDIRSRLLAAITEARVWINKITTTQGTLLYLVAYKSRPKTMRYFLQLVEAIINKRINNAIKLDGFLRILEKVEEGEIQMINILGADKFEDEENEEKIVKKQLRQLFITVYKIAEREATQRGKELSQQAIVLLRILAAKYRAGLHPHLELIARYIGQELLNTETQLEAAMIFLSRLDTAEVKLKEFEAYCDIKCEKKKQKHVIKAEESKSEADIKSMRSVDTNRSKFK